MLVLSADLTASTEIDLFQTRYPDRFLSFGVAEQNMVSMAGGLAREGFFPFIHTFAVFIYRRAPDQIAMSVAYPNLPVRMFGFLPGITTPAEHHTRPSRTWPCRPAEHDDSRLWRRHRRGKRAGRRPRRPWSSLCADAARRQSPACSTPANP